ncbi:UvrD-helicase domain-containing protein, partial [Candidatus Saccharibacteria bacterium]|nr:UvrD-helicase domain-containing protein [Candidatus Saccharibacteria bacterium]
MRQDRAIRREREAAIRAKLLDAYKTIGDVEGWKLDAQQMECITKEARSHLVIAGAGTGKTTTIVGKIKYMLRKGTLRPENILVLSFTNASAKEMRERIAKETDERIEASTFHKLGLNIIKSVHGRAGMPGISEIDMEEFIKARIPEADEGTRKLVET